MTPLNWNKGAACFQPQGGGSSPEPLPLAKLHLHWHQDLCWFMEIKPSLRLEELLLNMWALAADVLASAYALLPQRWLRLHHSPSFCGGRSRLSSTQLAISQNLLVRQYLYISFSQPSFTERDWWFQKLRRTSQVKSNTATHASFHSEIRLKLFSGLSCVSHGCNRMLPLK